MPIKILERGFSVTVDAEDWELVDSGGWHIHLLQPSQRPTAAQKQCRFGREFRLLLHREVVLRMRPDLVGKHFRVAAINGDYLDCRRENLDVRVGKKKRGRPPIESRPKGWRRVPYGGESYDIDRERPVSPAWAGGYEYRKILRGGKLRVRKCIDGKPVE